MIKNNVRRSSPEQTASISRINSPYLACMGPTHKVFFRPTGDLYGKKPPSVAADNVRLADVVPAAQANVLSAGPQADLMFIRIRESLS